jgi:hypothetical protein
MELFYLVAGCLLAAALAGVWVFRSSAQLPAFDRLAAALIPVSGTFLVIQTVLTLSQGRFFLWNDVRLARGLALAYGYKLYYDAQGGPIIGTLHAPLGYAVYTGLSLLHSPSLVLLAGCTLSASLVFGPIAWVVLRMASPRRPLWTFRILLFLGCSLMVFRSAGLNYSAFRIHADAAALGFGAMAASFLCRWDGERPWRDLMLSAGFAVLSCWSKQTLAPLVVALPAFVWMAGGFRQVCKYVVCLTGAGAAISALVLAAFWPPQSLWFNIIVVPASQPRGERGNLMRSLSLLSSENLLPVTVIVFLVLSVFFFEDHARTGLRLLLAEQPWLVFTFVAVGMVPTFVAGELKVGGDVNHLSLVSYFVLLAAGAGLAAHLGAGEGARAGALRSATRIFSTIFVLVGMYRMPLLLLDMIGPQAVVANSSQAAYNYEKAHAGVAYFPFNPLAALLASGKLYHSDIGLMDRQLSGFGIDQEQFRKYVPRDFQMVAIPPGAPATTKILAQELQGFTRAPGTGDLAGWIVYQRPAR